MDTYLIKKISRSTLRLGCLAIVAGVSLSACTPWHTETYMIDKSEKTTLTKSKTRLEHQTRNVDLKLIGQIADDYRRSGSGAVKVTVTYEPDSKANTSYRASSNLANIVKGLRNEGVVDVETEILPVINAGGVSMTYISYTGIKLTEADCDMMQGIEHSNTTIDKDYKLGCSIERHMARQIANPKDMVGEPTSKDTMGDGKRAVKVSSDYRNVEAEELTGTAFSEQ